jgi:heme/copper-type cytochrome/quinol oxidase subunit 2
LAPAPPRTFARRWAVAVALAAVAACGLLIAAPAGASVISPRAAHSPNASDIRTAYWVALIVAGVLVVVGHVAVFAALARFRERRGAEPARLQAGRGFFVRAGAPLAVLALGLFAFGIVYTEKAEKAEPTGAGGLQASAAQTAQTSVRGVDSQALAQAIETLRNTTPSSGPIGGTVKGGPLAIDAVAQQWLWRFFYPGGPTSAGTYSSNGGRPGDRTFSYTDLTVPVDTTVVLNITSTDVLHRWFVPALGGQVDAVPGHVTQTWFRADRTGVYPGQSTAFSGTGYSSMRIFVHVVSPSAYQSFLKTQTADLQSSQNYVNHAVESGTVPSEGAP